MTMNKLVAALSLAGAAFAASAAPSITNNDGVLTPFGGFDWASGAAAWTSGYTGVVGSTFTLYYAATAVALNDTGSGTLYTPKLDTNPNGTPITAGAYEYTIFAKLTETVTANNGTSADFKVTGGTFDIYYDTAANARQSNGTGYLDGVKIISGNVDPSGTQTFNTATGGQEALSGTVTFTNSAYITPALVGSNLTSTLQLGSAVTNFNSPTGFDFDNNGTSDPLGSAAVIIFQADANQTFTAAAVPEPTALLLAGAALAACGAATRRRKAA